MVKELKLCIGFKTIFQPIPTVLIGLAVSIYFFVRAIRHVLRLRQEHVTECFWITDHNHWIWWKDYLIVKYPSSKSNRLICQSDISQASWFYPMLYQVFRRFSSFYSLKNYWQWKFGIVLLLWQNSPVCIYCYQDKYYDVTIISIYYHTISEMISKKVVKVVQDGVICEKVVQDRVNSFPSLLRQ